MTPLAVSLVTLAVVAADPQAKDAKPAPPAARVTVTLELACLHCTFGEGDTCAPCLKLNDKTPIVLAGKAAKKFEADCLSKKVVVIEGTLSLGKDKRLVLTSDSGRFWTEADKGKAPEKGQAQVAGIACCGRCDLSLCDDCVLAIKNATFPVILDGTLATQHADDGKEGKSVAATGLLFIDKRGLLRLDAKKVEPGKQ